MFLLVSWRSSSTAQSFKKKHWRIPTHKKKVFNCLKKTRLKRCGFQLSLIEGTFTQAAFSLPKYKLKFASSVWPHLLGQCEHSLVNSGVYQKSEPRPSWRGSLKIWAKKPWCRENQMWKQPNCIWPSKQNRIPFSLGGHPSLWGIMRSNCLFFAFFCMRYEIPHCDINAVYWYVFHIHYVMLICIL